MCRGRRACARSVLDLWPCTEDQRRHLERLLGLAPPPADEPAGAGPAADVRACAASPLVAMQLQAEAD
jgi:hypothetical protein